MKSEEKNLVVYQTQSGALEIRQDVDRETVWATQKQIAEIFGVERSVVTKHIRSIFWIMSWMKKWLVQNLHKPETF